MKKLKVFLTIVFLGTLLFFISCTDSYEKNPKEIPTELIDVSYETAKTLDSGQFFTLTHNDFLFAKDYSFVVADNKPIALKRYSREMDGSNMQDYTIDKAWFWLLMIVCVLIGITIRGAIENK